MALLPGVGAKGRAALNHVGRRLAPYLRYFSSHRPTDDHGVRPAVMVVFDGEIAAHPLPARGAGGDPRMARVTRASLWVSHRGGRGRPGAAGTRLARPGGRLGVAPGPAAPMKDE